MPSTFERMTQIKALDACLKNSEFAEIGRGIMMEDRDTGRCVMEAKDWQSAEKVKTAV